jgi:glycosyltransferase involved in cell wall biosynthesis
VYQRVYDVERRGMMSAIRVLAVSELTRNLCVQRYGIPEGKVDVVYNGIDDARHQPGEGERINAKDKIVLFLGRITMQKGPEYFIAAAKRVLEKCPEAKFIMAGAGDMEVRMIELAAQLGIGHRVLFTGFLRGADVDRIYQMADVYVMPSVSEPFGIAPLEAIRNGAPVIISKTSGVSEVLTHALKVDFWDIDSMANLIVAVLRHPPLQQTLREHGSFELRRLTWDTAADACVASYRKAVDELRTVAV